MSRFTEIFANTKEIATILKIRLKDNFRGLKPVIAPRMASLQEAIDSFQKPKAPYARGGNTPASNFLEQRILEYLVNNKESVAPKSAYIALTASGQGANNAIFEACYGGNMVASKHLFGTTQKALTKTFQGHGGDIAYVDPCDTQAFINNSDENTTVWFLEEISNPAGRTADLAALRKAADERGILLVVDQTLSAGMPNHSALEHAHVATISLTKQAGGGKNENIGGAIIIDETISRDLLAKNFPKTKEHFSDSAISPLGALASNIGLYQGSGVISQRDAISVAKSLPSLKRRVRKMAHNAKAIVESIKNHPHVKDIQLAGVHTDPENDARTQQSLGDNHFVILVEFTSDEIARHFVQTNLYHGVALGQKETAVSHPSSSTHRSYSKEDLAAMGIQPNTVRISVGDERTPKLLKNVTQSLEL